MYPTASHGLVRLVAFVGGLDSEWANWMRTDALLLPGYSATAMSSPAISRHYADTLLPHAASHMGVAAGCWLLLVAVPVCTLSLA